MENNAAQRGGLEGKKNSGDRRSIFSLDSLYLDANSTGQ
jgi:hypothetical protein